MSGTTTAFLTDAKKHLLNGGAHLLAATVAISGTTNTGTKTITSLASTAGLYRGMNVSGTGVAAGAVIKTVDSTTQITMSDLGTSSATNTITFSGDTFNIALIKVTPTGTYDSTSTKYSDITGNSDEVSGTGYSAGGQALSANNGAAVTSTTAYAQWSTNPSWTTATISTTACMIYNTASSCSVVKPGYGVFDFGGTQTVTGGTLTLLQPSNTSTTALFRLQ